MSEGIDDVLRRALGLPTEDRVRVAEALLSSVEPEGAIPFDPEWISEAKRRAARIDAGAGRTSTWAEVRDRARGAREGLKGRKDTRTA